MLISLDVSFHLMLLKKIRRYYLQQLSCLIIAILKTSIHGIVIAHLMHFDLLKNYKNQNFNVSGLVDYD